MHVFLYIGSTRVITGWSITYKSIPLPHTLHVAMQTIIHSFVMLSIESVIINIWLCINLIFIMHSNNFATGFLSNQGNP